MLYSAFLKNNFEIYELRISEGSVMHYEFLRRRVRAGNSPDERPSLFPLQPNRKASDILRNATGRTRQTSPAPSGGNHTWSPEGGRCCSLDPGEPCTVRGARGWREQRTITNLPAIRDEAMVAGWEFIVSYSVPVNREL